MLKLIPPSRTSVLAASILRLRALLNIDLLDFTYTAISADILSLLEPALMITCACLPIMRPLFQKLLPSSLARSSARRAGRRHTVSGSHTLNSGSGSGGATGALPKSPRVGIRGSMGQDGFRRLVDAEGGTPPEGREYPLVDLPHSPAKAQRDGAVAGAGRRGVETVTQANNEKSAERGIQVRTDWTVSSA